MDSNIQAAVNSLTLAQATIDGLNARLLAASPMVFADLQYKSWLVASGTAANTGAIGNTATSQQTLPGAAMATRTLQPDGPYADKYWYLSLGANPSLMRFRQEYAFLFPTSLDSVNAQAVETDLQQCIGGVCFNWGFQFDYAESLLRVWNRNGKSWVNIGFTASRPLPGQWVTIQLDCHRDAANVYYDVITLNGAKLPLATNMGFVAPKLGLADMLNVGQQLDGEKVPSAYSIAIDRMKLTGWQV